MYTVYSKDKKVGCHIGKWCLQGNLQSSFEWMGEQEQFLAKQSLNSQPFKLL